MSTTLPVILILGAGKNVGNFVNRTFAAKGYKVALVSRSLNAQDSTKDCINIRADLSNPESIIEVFSKVKTALGLPSVVVYNASAGALNDAKKTFAIELNDFGRSLNVNTTSAFVAAQQAVLGFEQLPTCASKTFIYTGNILNTSIIPILLMGGIGKSASAHMIEVAATAYAGSGLKFYYADERNADGSPAYSKIDGEAHGDHYVKLAEGHVQEPWHQTFVKGVDIRSFKHCKLLLKYLTYIYILNGISTLYKQTFIFF